MVSWLSKLKLTMCPFFFIHDALIPWLTISYSFCTLSIALFVPKKNNMMAMDKQVYVIIYSVFMAVLFIFQTLKKLKELSF